MTIMHTLNNVYRIELDRTNSLLFTDESFRYRCIFRVYENVMNRLIVELVMNEYDIIELEDILYYYMNFGGYDHPGMNLSKTSTTNRFQFALSRLPNDNVDQLIIREINQFNIPIDRVKLNFNDEAGEDCSIYDLFSNLYEEFIYDIMDLADIASDYA